MNSATRDHSYIKSNNIYKDDIYNSGGFTSQETLQVNPTRNESYENMHTRISPYSKYVYFQSSVKLYNGNL